MTGKKFSTPPSDAYLSTGEVARLCSVTPDTVLKWIRAGRIPAERTPGGHHRVHRDALRAFVGRGGTELRGPEETSDALLFCWEFSAASGRDPDECKACMLFLSRAHRCYDVSGFPGTAHHRAIFCEGHCAQCDYYRSTNGQKPHVLVVTDQVGLKTALERGTRDFDFDLRTTDCEYRCSMLIERFRPDYVVIDCSLGRERSYEFARFIYEDPRIPLVRIVLAGEREGLPLECDKMIFARSRKHLTPALLSDLVRGFRP